MKIFTFYRFIITLCLLFIVPFSVYAQRNYASTQQSGVSGVCVLCGVVNTSNAIDGNLQTFSTLTVTLGLNARSYQELIFPAAAKVPANTPVTIKLGSGNKLVDVTLLGGILLQAYNGANPIGSPVAAASLLSAASGNNQFEVKFAPTQLFDRIRITLDAGLLGAVTSIEVYDAFYGTGPGPCNIAIDELHGISSALLGLGLNIGGVANPERAIDGNISTASTLNAGVSLLGAYAQQTVIFNSSSIVGDSVRLTLGIPQALLDLSVTNNISVTTFNGNTSNNDTRSFSSALVNLRLLDLSGGVRKVTVTFVPTQVFDRVQLRLGGGIANALSTLNLYEMEHVLPSPVVTVNGTTVSSVQVCSGSPAVLTATSVANTTYNWYTVPTGGVAVFTGAVYTTGNLTTTTTYYVEAVRNGCTDASQRTPVTVNVVPLPAAVAISGSSTATICQGQTATFTATAVAGVTVNWYTAATGGTPIFTGNTFTTPVLNANTTYYAEAVNANGCVATARTPVTVTVNPTPVVPALSSNAITISTGQTTTITITNPAIGVTYNWYSAVTGGTLVHTGTSYTTGPLTANTTFYVEGVSGTCTSPVRAQVVITVNSGPDITVMPATQAVNNGQTATLTAVSTTPNAIINWYTTPTGGTPIFTGPTFTTPAITANVTYYADATDPVTNGVSPSRASGAITVNNGNGTTGPDITVAPPTQAVNAGQTATFTASSTTPGAIFNWYTTPTGGAPVFTGSSFTTPPINGDVTYYADATDPVSGIPSPTRATGTVTLNGGGGNTGANVIVTPPTQSVNAGQTATFTATSTTPNQIFDWYTTPTGGTSIFTGPTFTTPPLNANVTYYAEAKDPVTGAISPTRASGAVTVNAVVVNPDITVIPATQAVNSGQTATLTAVSTTPNAIFNWYTTSTGGTSIFTGATFTTPAVTSDVTYYVDATDPITGGVSSTRASGTVTVNNNVGPDITVTPPTQAVNAGQTATFTASSTTPNAVFNWYTTATGGTPVFTGAIFTTQAINGNITYYADATDPISGLPSPTRTTAIVTVNGGGGNTGANVMVTPPTQAVNAGQTATFTASSTTPNQLFDWYTTSTGGTPVFTGPTFTTPPINADVTYYAEARDPNTGAVSPTRASGAVTVNNSGGTPPTVSVTPPSQSVNAGQTATFTASSTNPNAVFDWYTTPTGGTSIFTGATFNTPQINADVTYYAEAKDPVTGAVSTTRATGTVTVNPVVNPDIAVVPLTQAVNSGQTATLTAVSTTPNAIFHWYTTPTGGSPIFTGATFTTPAITADVTYYAEATDPATGGVSSTRASGTITVNSGNGTTGPDITVTPPTQAVNAGQTAVFTASSTTPNAVFNWYTSPTGGTPVFTGATFTTPPINGNVTYYADATDPVSGIPSPSRATATVTVNGGGGNTGATVTITPPTQSVNSGQTATFTASSTTPNQEFDWYTTPTGGTPIFTGPTFTTPSVTADVTYYAEARDPNTGITSPTRASGDVTVNNTAGIPPTIDVLPPSQSVNSGQAATFTATSTTPGAIINWYTTPTGGTPIFTGPIFNTPPVNADVTYYAEAKDPISGTVSTTRATATVTVIINHPNIVVAPASQSINSGQTATLTAVSTTPNAIFNWYTTPSGGTPIFTGPTFTTPALTASVTYYADATDPMAGGVSSTRASGAITVNNNVGPDITVTPPTQAVNAGQTATFTASSTTPNTVFNWYTTPTGGTPVFTGPTFTTPLINGDITYYVDATDPGTGIPSPSRATASVTINGGGGNTGATVMVTPPTQSVNNGDRATFTASSTSPGQLFDWYTTPTGGTPIFTGPTFTTPPVTADVIYYAEARDPNTGITSPTRAGGSVTVNPNSGTPPTIAVTPPTQSVDAGQTATFTASSSAPNQIFNWYTTPTGGTPIYTGTVFVTPPINGNVTYYAEAKDPVTGVVSTTRATGTVTLSNGGNNGGNPDVVVTPPTQNVNQGDNAIFIASSTTPNATFSWYTTPTGGSPIFIGSNFTTPPVNGNTTYYAEAKNPVTGAVSVNRASAVVIINPAPDVAITPPTQNVNQGQTATFTASSTTPNAIFNWYMDPSSETPIFTGPVFITPPVTGTMVVYLESKHPVTGAKSLVRAMGTVFANAAPDIAVTPPTRTINSGATTTFTASSTMPNAIFKWYDSPTATVPIYTGPVFTTPAITANKIYYVEAVDPSTNAPSLVRATATVNLDLTTETVFVPNAFTPNGDGRNDIMYVQGPNIKSMNFSVYDQWGELQFRTVDINSGWDGTYKGRAQPTGVYVYYVEATLTNNNVIKKKGTITLLR